MGKLEIARERWGEDLPGWIEELAKACDATSQGAVARRLELSSATVSTVIGRTYGARDYSNVEQVVRGVLLAETVDCPALGELSLDKCLRWRRQGRSFVPSNPLVRKMYRACRRCPRNGGEE